MKHSFRFIKFFVLFLLILIQKGESLTCYTCENCPHVETLQHRGGIVPSGKSFPQGFGSLGFGTQQHVSSNFQPDVSQAIYPPIADGINPGQLGAEISLLPDPHMLQPPLMDPVNRFAREINDKSGPVKREITIDSSGSDPGGTPGPVERCEATFACIVAVLSSSHSASGKDVVIRDCPSSQAQSRLDLMEAPLQGRHISMYSAVYACYSDLCNGVDIDEVQRRSAHGESVRYQNFAFKNEIHFNLIVTVFVFICFII